MEGNEKGRSRWKNGGKNRRKNYWLKKELLVKNCKENDSNWWWRRGYN